MSNRYTPPHRALCAFSLVLLTTGMAAAQADLLRPVTEVPEAVNDWHRRNTEGDATLAAWRFVRVDATRLAPDKVLAVRLFDRTVRLQVTRRQSSLRHTIYEATVRGETGQATFAVGADGVVAASIDAGGRTYAVEYSGHAGIHRLSRVDLDKSTVPGCGVDHRHEVDPGPEKRVLPASAVRNVDVAVFYTPRARSTGGGKAAIEAEIALRIANATRANNTCKVPWAFRLVHVAETSYTETGGTEDLSRFRSTSDSYMRDVHQARQVWGADLMALITQPTRARYCGVAYLMTRLSTGFSSAAFGVTLRQCLRGHTLSHEMGHNCGSHHDRANAGRALFSYSYGYRTAGNRYRSIMSYSPGSRVNQWSSATVKYNGQSIGTVNDDNARSLTNAGNTIAGFRATRTLEWCELRGGVAGQNGVPTVAGAGTVNDTRTLRVTWGRVRSGTAGVAVIGGRAINLSLLGGTLVPSLDIVIPVVARGQTATLDAAFMKGVPSGVSVWFQGWFLDRAARQGFSASNGLSTKRP